MLVIGWVEYPLQMFGLMVETGNFVFVLFLVQFTYVETIQNGKRYVQHLVQIALNQLLGKSRELQIGMFLMMQLE